MKQVLTGVGGTLRTQTFLVARCQDKLLRTENDIRCHQMPFIATHCCITTRQGVTVSTASREEG